MLQRLRQRLHDARLAVERWLLVMVFRYQPEFADALIRAAELRREYAALAESIGHDCQAGETILEQARALTDELVRALVELEATERKLIARERQTGDAAPDSVMEFVHHQKAELHTRILDGRARVDALTSELQRLRALEHMVELIANAPMLG